MAASESLVRVDSLKITFLVDNAIEWFTKLPPGFSSELSQHIKDLSPPIDEVTGVPFLDLENYCCGAHGFSALIKTQVEGSETHTVLFDTGPDSKSLIRNIESMKVPVDAVERIILSHWHGDHSGGLLSFLRYRNGYGSELDDVAAENVDVSSGSGSAGRPRPTAIVVDLHPDRPVARGFAPPPGDRILARLPEEPTFDEIRALGAGVELHSQPHVVAGDTIYVSGEIPRVTEFEQGLLGAVRWVKDESVESKFGWVDEPHIMDERYAAIDVVGKGLVIFSACSHAGIVNVLTDTVKTLKRPVHMVIGGLHLGGPELAYRIAPTVNFLSQRLRPSPAYVLPMHCSGFAVKIALEDALGEGCIPTGVGISVYVKGDVEADERLFPPVIS